MVAASTFIRTTRVNCSYNADAKKRFHSQAASVLRQLAVKLGFEKKDFDLRHNQGGIAVSGEITLHSDGLYVQFAQSALGHNSGFMWRTCKGRKDYTGGPNQWMQWEQLGDLDAVAATMKRLMQSK